MTELLIGNKTVLTDSVAIRQSNCVACWRSLDSSKYENNIIFMRKSQYNICLFCALQSRNIKLKGMHKNYFPTPTQEQLKQFIEISTGKRVIQVKN